MAPGTWHPFNPPSPHPPIPPRYPRAPADHLTPEGKRTLLAVAKGLETQYPAKP